MHSNSEASRVSGVSRKKAESKPFVALELTKLYNFRDVSRPESKIKRRIVFRGANLCYASPEDADFLINTLKIKTLIDMRRTQERGVDSDGIILGPLRPYFFGPEKKDRSYYNIPLTDTTSFSIAIIANTSPWAFTKALYHGAMGRKSEMERTITKSALGGKSLEELYVLFLINATPQIYKVLMILIDATKYPVTFFCSGGKDRTGIITMLIQGCCHEDYELIIDSYHESEANLTVVGDKLRAENERDGLDPLVYAATPKKVMKNLLNFIDHRWGGIPQYLSTIGFNEENQKALRSILLNK